MKKIFSYKKLFALSVIILASCGQPSESSSPISEGDFEINGVQIGSETKLEQLPEVASKVKLTGGIDNKVFCLDSSPDVWPPLACQGLSIEGLEMDGWGAKPDDESSFLSGTRTVEVSWPPRNNKVSLIADSAPPKEEPLLAETSKKEKEARFLLPATCKKLDWGKTVGVEVLREWAHANPDKAAFTYLKKGVDTSQDIEEETPQTEIGVLQVVSGHMDLAYEELTTGSLAPCIAEVENSYEDLDKARDQIRNMDYESINLQGMYIDEAHNKLQVNVLVADRSTVKRIAQTVDTNSLLFIKGTAEIIE